MSLCCGNARASAPAHAGFSLLETLVVLAIIGILLVLSLGGNSLLDNRRLAGAARTLVTDLRLAEQRARAERTCWRVEFDRAGERYHVRYLAGGAWTPTGGCTGGTWTDYTPEAGTQMPRRIDLVATTFATDRLTISPFGNPNAGTVTLGAPGGAVRSITVSVMGRVTVGP